MVPDAELVARSSLVTQEYSTKRVTRERVEAPYDTLTNGDRTTTEKYWGQDMVWLAPGESQVSSMRKRPGRVSQLHEHHRGTLLNS
jgi:hypothetical protein